MRKGGRKIDPRRDDDAIVELMDVILRKGVLINVDLLITVGDVPLIGLKLQAVIAGMAKLREYGIFEEWDERMREEVQSQNSPPRTE